MKRMTKFLHPKEPSMSLGALGYIRSHWTEQRDLNPLIAGLTSHSCVYAKPDVGKVWSRGYI